MEFVFEFWGFHFGIEIADWVWVGSVEIEFRGWEHGG